MHSDLAGGRSNPITKIKPFDSLRRQIDADPARRVRVEEMKRAMRDVRALSRLREARGMTQVESPAR